MLIHMVQVDAGTRAPIATDALEPALRPFRRFLPNLGGVDLSPLALIVVLLLIQGLMHEYLRPAG